MTEQAKAKEFWIYYFSTGKGQISNSPISLDDEFISEPLQTRGIKPSEVFHVIEYSAYKQIEEENAAIKSRIEKLREALVLAEQELFRYNMEAPLEISVVSQPVYLVVRAALKADDEAQK